MNKQFHPLTDPTTLQAAEPLPVKPEPTSVEYQYKETRELVSLVKDAVALVRAKGEEVFSEFGVPGSRWRQGETYIFVLEPGGHMLVHPDPVLEGKNDLGLKDVNGKPIIRGLIDAATALSGKSEGWYHYEWPVPGGFMPRWKSTYVQEVTAPSGKSYIVGGGMYNDRMEREFVVDIVQNAVGAIEKDKETAFQLFHDPTGPYRAKDAYIFVLAPNGISLVHPGFMNLEGSSLLDVKDSQGKYPIRDMIELVQTRGSGWIDYMWPKPGEYVPTQKSAYVTRVKCGNGWVLVGCGVYLADAPKAVPSTKQMTAPELMKLVRDAAILLEQKGEKVFPEFRQKGSRWFNEEVYLWVWSINGTRLFHAEKPEGEGKNVAGMKDVIGRPFGRMFIEAASTPMGEGWIHAMWPRPFDIFPAWKSCFVKRVTFPSGKQCLVGSGIYNMQMDKTFIEDLVNRAADLVAEKGKDAFPLLRDKTGPFVFMDMYVFVDNLQGVELVNAGQPSVEGKNLMSTKDLEGKYLVRDYLDAAVKNGRSWVHYYWYKPGANVPAYKQSYVRKVLHEGEAYVVGAGFYREEPQQTGSKGGS